MCKCLVWSISLASTEEKEEQMRNALLAKEQPEIQTKKAISLVSTKQDERKARRTGRKQRVKEEKEHQMQKMRIIMVLYFLYKNRRIILGRNCPVRGEKENLLFSRVIHARCSIMQKERSRRKTNQSINESYRFELNKYRKKREINEIQAQ